MANALITPGSAGAAPVYRKLIRSINGIVPDVAIEEQHQDRLVITEHPVEGGVVNDHTYKLPSEVVITYGWSPSGALNSAASPTFLTDLYNQILAMQWAIPASGPGVTTLFNVYTGKRIYTNMALESVTCTTDKDTENVLLIRMLCKQLLIANVTTLKVQLDAATQADPEKTQAAASQGTQTVQQTSLFNPASLNDIKPTWFDSLGTFTGPGPLGGGMIQ